MPHQPAARHARHAFAIGAMHVSRTRLECLHERGEKLHVHVAGVLVLAADISPELAASTIERVHVRGWIRATPEVRDALGGTF